MTHNSEAALSERMLALEKLVRRFASVEPRTTAELAANRTYELVGERLLRLENLIDGLAGNLAADKPAATAELAANRTYELVGERLLRLENLVGGLADNLAADKPAATAELAANRTYDLVGERLLRLENLVGSLENSIGNLQGLLTAKKPAVNELSKETSNSSDWNASGRPTALFELDDFELRKGALYVARCPSQIPPGDDSASLRRSRLLLLENGTHLGPSHSDHDDIAARGGGAYSHWGTSIYVSTSDNSDPRTNGRRYQAVWTATGTNPRVEAAHEILGSLKSDFSTEEAYVAVQDMLSILYPVARMGDDTKLFWHDEQALQDYRRLVGSNMRSFERKIVVFNIVRALGHVDGDLAECGAFEGATAFFMARADRKAGRRRPLHLFDSFEGLSSPDSNDGGHWQKGDLSASEEKLKINLAEFEQVSIYKGWIPTQFHNVSDREFSFVHLDVDLYQPTRDSLDFFYPRVLKNGIILCDDSGTATCPGATQAMVEFFADKPETIISLPTGQDFITKQ